MMASGRGQGRKCGTGRGGVKMQGAGRGELSAGWARQVVEGLEPMHHQQMRLYTIGTDAAIACVCV